MLRDVYEITSDVGNILCGALTVSHSYRLHETYSKTRPENSSAFRESMAVRSRSVVFTTPIDVHRVHSAVNVRSNGRDISSGGWPHRRTSVSLAKSFIVSPRSISRVLIALRGCSIARLDIASILASPFAEKSTTR